MVEYVTEAIGRELPLLTRDPVIQQSGLVSLLWNFGDRTPPVEEYRWAVR